MVTGRDGAGDPGLVTREGVNEANTETAAPEVGPTATEPTTGESPAPPTPFGAGDPDGRAADGKPG